MIEINPNKCQEVRQLGSVDLGPLKTRIANLTSSDWDTPEDYRLNYNKVKSLRDVAHIVLRFIDKQKEPFTYLIGSRWSEWEAALLPIMKQAVEPYGYRQGRFVKVMLARLKPNAFIPPHIDGTETGYVPHKIHVPITTNEQCFFFIENQRYRFEVGHAYEVNNGRNHRVVNGGNSHRIHLIFEYLDYDLQTDEIKARMDQPTLI